MLLFALDDAHRQLGDGLGRQPVPRSISRALQSSRNKGRTSTRTEVLDTCNVSRCYAARHWKPLNIIPSSEERGRAPLAQVMSSLTRDLRAGGILPLKLGVRQLELEFHWPNATAAFIYNTTQNHNCCWCFLGLGDLVMKDLAAHIAKNMNSIIFI